MPPPAPSQLVYPGAEAAWHFSQPVPLNWLNVEPLAIVPDVSVAWVCVAWHVLHAAGEASCAAPSQLAYPEVIDAAWHFSQLIPPKVSGDNRVVLDTVVWVCVAWHPDWLQ